MQHCIMKDPPDGTECGGFEDIVDPFAFADGDDGHSWELEGNFAIGGTRVTPRRGNQGGTVNYRLGTEDEAAFAALIATMSVDPGGTDTELCDERARGVITNGTGTCGTELEDRYWPVITMGGDDEDTGDTAARFTPIDATESHGDHGAGGGGFLGDEEEGSIFGITGDNHIYEGRRARSLVPCC